MPVRLLTAVMFTLVAPLATVSAQDTRNAFRLMILGDSLSDPAWRDIERSDAFPRNIAIALRELGYKVRMIPLARSGDEVYDGLVRLEKWLSDGNVPPDGVIIELGTNDALRQKNLAWTERDLRTILQKFEDLDVEVLLTGAYGNYPAYGGGFLNPSTIDAFEVLYLRLAAEYDTLLYSYFLAGVLADPTTYTSDNLHPNAAGVDLIVERILPEAEALLLKAGAVRARTSRQRAR